MPFNKYYQDEFVFLREMGAEFARAYPRLAPFLAGEGNDPDVERLLEGFAFLTGRIRQKLDDELPELTHSLMALLWPHFLRPVPAMSMLQFQPIPHLVSEKKKIPRGIEIESVPVYDEVESVRKEGTPCRFRTCYDVEVHPLALEQAEVHSTGAASTLRLEFVLNPGVSVDSLQLDSLRLYLHSEPFFVAQSLYLWLHRYLARITVQPVGERRAGQRLTLPPTAIRPVGFTDQEGLLPYPPNAFIGYRLLQEYFTLPHKFLFVEIMGLAPIARLAIRDRFEFICEFSHPLAEQVRLTRDNVRLYCTPIVNLFPQDADPIRLEHNKAEYRVRPSGPLTHFEIYALDRVVGWVQGSGERRVYQPFLSFDHSVTEDDRQTIYYCTRLVPAVTGRGADTYIAFVSPRDEQAFPPTETVSIEITCTNRDVPEKLRVGDISMPTGNSPEFARCRNISPVTPSVLPPLDRGLHWQLISNLSLNYMSLVDVKALRLILSTYNFQAYDDRDRQATRAHALRLEGLSSIRYTPLDRLLKGSPIRGLRINMDMQESKFAGEGDMYLLASVLNEFFALYTTINSFHQLVVRNVDRGEEYQWPARIGQQLLL